MSFSLWILASSDLNKRGGGGDETGMNEVNHPELIPYWNNLSCLKIRGCVNAT